MNIMLLIYDSYRKVRGIASYHDIYESRGNGDGIAGVIIEV